MPSQDKERIKKIIEEWEAVDKRKSSYNSLWDDLASVMLTRRAGFASAVVEGADRMVNIMDGTPMQSARSLANNVGHFLRPQNDEWMFIRSEDDQVNNDDEAQEWLEDSRIRLLNAMRNPKARFLQATGEIDLDLVVLGTGIMFIGETKDLGNLLYQSLALNTASVSYNDEDIPDTLFRTKSLTLRQAELKFGLNNLSEDARRQINEGKKHDKIRFLQGIRPRKNASPNPILATSMPWEHVWIEVDTKHMVFDGGYMEFPFVAPRWDTTSGEDYGRSPGMVALPDSNTLQAMGETILVSGQRAADPPLMAPNDGSFSAINTFPGGLSYYDVDTASAIGGNPFFTLQSGVNLPITRDMQQDTRSQVMAAFFRNVLNLPIDGPQMTATEVLQRKEEFIREIGPVFGRLESDYTAPMVERSFNIMLRAGAFAPIPEILQGSNVKFEFQSPVTKIREQVQAAAAKQWVSEMMEISQVNPDVMDNVNFDEFARFTADSSNVPKQIINNRQSVEDIRQAKLEQLQAQREMIESEQSAGIAEKFSKAAKNSSQAEQPVAV